MMRESLFEQRIIELHTRLLAGDVTAPAEIAELILPRLLDYMRRRFPKLYDPHMADTAVEDALISYLRRPNQFDPEKGSLWPYLKMSARYDLLNLLSEKKGDIASLAIPGIVELDDEGSEYQIEEGNALNVEERVAILTSPIWQKLQDHVKNQTDQGIVILMMEGIRQTSEYAKVLNVEHLPQVEKVRIVKRHKDRLKKMLQRYISQTELREE
jgi:RNA polymerase sigma-70 factor (ECF subfamily)